MRSRDVIGRRIVEVRQVRTQDNCGDVVYDVQGFVLDDGTWLYFTVAELDGDYAVLADARKPERRKSVRPDKNPLTPCVEGTNVSPREAPPTAPGEKNE